MGETEGRPSRAHGFRFEPRSLDEAIRVAELVATSSIIPQRYQGKPQDILVATGYGAELGISFLQSLQAVIVQNGTPTIWGDHALGLVKASGILEWITESFDSATQTARCEVKRRTEPQPVVRTFSMAEAQQAGLVGRTPSWRAYPQRMLQMRARGFALRDVFPDVLRGMYLAEEFDSPATPQPVDVEAGVVEQAVRDDSVAVEQAPEPEIIEMPKPKKSLRKPKESETPETLEPQGEPQTMDAPPDPAEAEPVEDGSAASAEGVERRVGVVDRVTKRQASSGPVYTIHFRDGSGSAEPVFLRTTDRAVAEVAHNYRGKRTHVTDAPDGDLGRRVVSITMADQ